MPLRRRKLHYLWLEALNALGVAYYYNYLFFYMQIRFDFSDRDNLILSAFNGFLYTFSAWQSGRLAQRIGYLQGLALGLGVMVAALLGGLTLELLHPLPFSVTLQVAVFALWTLGVSATWPALEALVSDHEPARSLPRVVGIYNVTWAGGWAFAYFTGGALLESLDGKVLFALPILIAAVQLTWIWRLHTRRAAPETAPNSPTPHAEAPDPNETSASPAQTALFRRLAWIGNPFAYLAISALVPLIPGLAARHELTPTMAGVVCSVWIFARLGAFFLLWHWPGWHYRISWFLCSFFALIVSFAGMLLASSLWGLGLFQILFGLATGLIYYSSLYYSMDAGHAKGEHGGIHEAGIGAGIFAGPAVGGIALYLFPNLPHVDTWAVSIALTIGWLAAVVLYRTRRTPA